MSWFEETLDCAYDGEMEDEYNNHKWIAQNLSDKKLAEEIQSVMDQIPNDEYFSMKMSILSKALRGNELTEKQRNVLENTYVNLRME